MGRLALGGAGAFALVVLALIAVPSLAGTLSNGPATMLAIRGGGSTHLVTANFSGNFTITKSSVAHNVTYLVATTLRTVTGNMAGIELAYEWGAVQANGSMWVSGMGTFVGTILGSAPGECTLTWSKVTGVYGVSLAGTVQVSNGQKGLNGVHGSGTGKILFTGGHGFAGSFSFHLDLD